MLSERMKELLLKAAKCFDDNRSPFTDQWLSENRVTLDECFALSEKMGMILRGFALSDDDTQFAIQIQASLND